MTYQLTLFQEAMALAAFFMIAQILIVPALLLNNRKLSKVGAIIRAFLIALAVMLVMIDDIKAMPPECHDYFEIVAVDEDQDMNRVYYILVSGWVQENGTDMVCENFGRCIYELIGDSPSMAAVSIVNPADDWVPSRWRWIEVNRARILAGIDELEASYAYNLSDRY
jgi:hypothetical protein